MSKCAIIDFETLDTIPSAAVTSLSILVFEPSEILPFKEQVENVRTIKFNWQEQIAAGRTTSESTLDFWRKPENKEAFNVCVAPKPDDSSLKDLNTIMYAYLKEQGYDLSEKSNDKVYCRGNTFDFGILDNIYSSMDWQPLFHFWNHRDVRTEVDSIAQHLDPDHKFNGYVNGFNIDGMVKHNSAHDVAHDVMLMQYVHYKLIQSMGD